MNLRKWRLRARASLCRGCLLTLGLCALIVLHVLFYIAGQYVGLYRYQESECVETFPRRHPRGNRSDFPKRIHQMYFGLDGTQMPKRWENAKKTWLSFNPDFEYTLWDSPRFQALLRSNYSELVPLYDGYDHWIMQTDVARLLILYHYGGVYSDLDIRSRSQLSTLYGKLPGMESAFYFSTPIGLANDFMVSRAGSGFLVHALCGLSAARRHYVLPYVKVMLSTGPLYLHLRYLTYTRQHEVHVFNTSSDLSGFIGHIDGRSWHQWDGAAIWWIYVNRKQVIRIVKNVFYVCVILVLFKIIIIRCLIRMYRRIRERYSKHKLENGLHSISEKVA